MFLARLFAVLLFLVALVCGGCSIAFAPLVLGDLSGGGGVPGIWVSGLVIAALCIWGGIALWRAGVPPAKGETNKTDGGTP